jgi:ribosomal protein S6--L-glutamate ligase
MGDLDNQYTENRIVMLRQLENDGVIVASRAGAIDAAVNRYRNTWLLRLANIPMPKTALTESRSSANAIVREWGKVVLKPLFTTKARGMRLLSRDDSDSDIDAALSQFEQEGRGPFYLQEFVESRGRDVAVTIMDGKVLGAFYRVAKPGNWKTTTQAGGHYEPCELGDDAAELALRAAKPFSLDFTSVDLVETEAGWLVYEVSAFGGFSGLKKAYGIDAAALYAKHIVEKVSNERN